MLYSKGRKNHTQSHFALKTLAVIALLLHVSACHYLHQPTYEEMAAETRRQILVDSTQEALAHLKELVTSSNDTLEVDIEVNKYYRQHSSFIWISEDSAFFEKGDSVACFLRTNALSMGFSPKAFFVDEIQQDIQALRQIGYDSLSISPSRTMARLELNLSKAFYRYAMGQRYGFTNPHHLLNRLEKRKEGGYRILYDIDIEKPNENFINEVMSHVNDESPTQFLSSLESQHPVYLMLKQKLIADSTGNERKRILCNMERLRWRHQQAIQMTEKQVFVNIPSQQLWAISPDTTFSMRICCGAWKTKTPLLSSHILRIQLNPEWNIPSSIIKDEVSAHAGDSAYFAHNNYFIIKRSTGDTIQPRDITKEQLKSGAYRVAQHSGRHNSLGRMIFRFSNQFDVYLHDTNNGNAFNYERRTISHGCVRIQHPFQLLRFLLSNVDEWNLDKIRLSIDMPPQGEKGKKYLKEHQDDDDPIRGIKINSREVMPSIPVVIDYYTLYPNPETGKWESWPDRYEYDQQIEKKIKPFLP